MTKVVGTPLRGIDFNSPSDEAVSARIAGDTHPRVRIDAGGRITWSSGAITGDTKLYRTEANTLFTEGIFSASGGIVTLATSGSPTVSMPDGALAIDTTNNMFYFRSSGAWTQVLSGGGNATIEISDTPPVSPTEGDLWFDSTDATTYIYYDSYWVDINGTSTVTPDIEQLNDVSVNILLDGDILAYSSALNEWTNVPIFSANPAINTTLTSSTATVIDYFDTAYYDSGEFFVEMKQGTKRLVTKINAIHNSSSTSFAQYGTAEIGSPGIAVTFTTDISGGNLRLLASVSDAAATNVIVQATKTLIRHF